jgi:hypothetical protein
MLSLCVELPFIRLFKYATIKLGSKYGSFVLKVSYNVSSIKVCSHVPNVQLHVKVRL